MTLSEIQKKRYSRQILLQNITEEGQERLDKATIAVIGLGALGSVISNNLVRAGIGKIILADRDVVELDNLHRQSLYDSQMLGQPKAVAAAEYLTRVNPEVEVKPIVKDVNFSTIGSIVSNSKVIMDGTDNMETRFLINDLSVKNSIPWIYGGVIGTQGMTMNFIPGLNKSTACFRCMVPEMPAAGSLPTCDTFGILNTIPDIIGSLQCTELFKLLFDSPNINRNLLFFDVWTNEYRVLDIPKNDACKCCKKKDFEYLNVKKRTIVTSLCGQDSVQINPIKSNAIVLADFEDKLAKVGRVNRTEYTLEINIEKYKITLFSDGRVLIKGTTDENVAKSIYARYIGS